MSPQSAGGYMRALAFLVLSNLYVALGAVNAASVSVTPQSVDRAIFFIEGEFQPGDEELFQEKICPWLKGVVMLDSKGGSLATGIQIGRSIRLRNFATYIPNGSRCSSACALAWLGGTTRLTGKHSLIGFHAAHHAVNRRESGMANAYVGKYLADLGLSYDAIAYITKAPPESMTWLTVSEAAQVGIELSVVDSKP
jgi:hypothetical protein